MFGHGHLEGVGDHEPQEHLMLGAVVPKEIKFPLFVGGLDQMADDLVRVAGNPLPLGIETFVFDFAGSDFLGIDEFHALVLGSGAVLQV